MSADVTGRFPPTPNPTNPRKSKRREKDVASAEANPVTKMQPRVSTKALRRPCLSAYTDQNMAPNSMPVRVGVGGGGGGGGGRGAHQGREAMLG